MEASDIWPVQLRIRKMIFAHDHEVANLRKRIMAGATDLTLPEIAELTLRILDLHARALLDLADEIDHLKPAPPA